MVCNDLISNCTSDWPIYTDYYRTAALTLSKWVANTPLHSALIWPGNKHIFHSVLAKLSHIEPNQTEQNANPSGGRFSSYPALQ